MYWCQPPYMPLGGFWKGDCRVRSASQTSSPRRPHSAAVASGSQTAAIDAWPGASMKPSRFASTQLASPADHAVIRSTTAVASGLGDVPRSSTALIAGHIRPRGSAVAPAFAAPSTEAGVCFGFFASSASSQSTRCVPPSSQRSSPAGKFFAGLLFQLTSRPLDGETSCGCFEAFRKPRHSNLPRPSTGRSGLTPLRRFGRRPVVTNAMSFSSA